jgi:hypothetical protein
MKFLKWLIYTVKIYQISNYTIYKLNEKNQWVIILKCFYTLLEMIINKR